MLQVLAERAMRPRSLSFETVAHLDLQRNPKNSTPIASIYRVADGVIAEEWICSDTSSLFRQISQGARR